VRTGYGRGKADRRCQNLAERTLERKNATPELEKSTRRDVGCFNERHRRRRYRPNLREGSASLALAGSVESVADRPGVGEKWLELAQTEVADPRIAVITTHIVASEAESERLPLLDIDGLAQRRRWQVVRHSGMRVMHVGSALWAFIESQGCKFLSPLLKHKSRR
jgi:hypothetical protein